MSENSIRSDLQIGCWFVYVEIYHSQMEVIFMKMFNESLSMKIAFSDFKIILCGDLNFIERLQDLNMFCKRYLKKYNIVISSCECKKMISCTWHVAPLALQWMIYKVSTISYSHVFLLKKCE